MEADVEGLIGAGRYERSGERSTWRNGYRERVLDTRLGSLQLRIPKLRQGSLPRDSKVVRSTTRRLAGLVDRRAGVAQPWGDQAGGSGFYPPLWSRRA